MQKVAALEQRVKSLESAVQVTPASIVIKTPGTVSIQASRQMELKASMIRLN